MQAHALSAPWSTSAFYPTSVICHAWRVRDCARQPSGDGKTTVLVVDDELATGELLGALLRSQGYLVRVLTSSTEALEALQRGGIDLLICDLMMPKLDGVELCSFVRHELRDLTLPIVIVTSLHDRESRLRAKEAGADDVLLKPLDGLELFVRIESLLRSRAYVVELTRERDAARAELGRTQVQLHLQQRTQRLFEGAHEVMRELLGEQLRVLESARRRWPSELEAREKVSRLTQLAGQLGHYVELLGGANTGSVARVSEEEVAAGTQPSSPRALSQK